MDVGFIGLGHTGQPVALNLLKAGHPLVVYNRTRSRAGALVAQGALAASNVAETCRAEVVISMLSDAMRP